VISADRFDDGAFEAGHPLSVDPRRRATVNLIAPAAGDDGGWAEPLRALGESLAKLGAPMRSVAPEDWSEAATLVVSPHDACVCADEHGAVLARHMRRTIAGPAFVRLVLDLDYVQRYGPVEAAAARPEHWPLACAELGQACPGAVRLGAATFDWPAAAIDPVRLSERLAGRERRLGLRVAGEPRAAFEDLGREAVRTARERGAFAGGDWSFALLRPGQADTPLLNDAPFAPDAGDEGGLDLCLRLGEGAPGPGSRTLAATGCVVVSERADPIGPWPPDRPVFADLVLALTAAVPRVEDQTWRIAVAEAAGSGLPRSWAAAFAPHSALLRRALARTLAAARRG